MEKSIRDYAEINISLTPFSLDCPAITYLTKIQNIFRKRRQRAIIWK
jgi:hypothetical protein